MTSGATPGATVLIVDDDPDMRFLVRAVLDGTSIDIVGEAAHGAEALDAFGRIEPPPTVILLDNQLPDIGGIDVAARLLARAPGQLIVLFSAHLDEGIEHRAATAGVTACVSKGDAIELPRILTDLVTVHRP